MSWHIKYTAVGLESLEEIPDRRIQKQIRDRIQGLTSNPDVRGKPLRFELSGFRSIVVGRYRVIYRLDEEQRFVIVVLIGIRKEGDRKDAYIIAQRLRSKGLI